MTATVIYPARKIRTVDRSVPEADAIALQSEKVLALGTLEELGRAYPDAEVDNRYRDAVLFPGFVEAHSHVPSGILREGLYIGYYPRTAPDGTLLPGCRTKYEVLEQLREANATLPPDAGLLGWGVDPIFFGGEHLTAADLDTVSNERPIFVIHASGHVASVNSAVLLAARITRGTSHEGVAKDADGQPTGELLEMAAMMMAGPAFEQNPFVMGTSRDALYDFAFDARNHGCTTATDLVNNDVLDGARRQLMLDVTAEDEFPVRLVPHFGATSTPAGPRTTAAAAALAELRSQSTSKLHLGNVKFVLDGSIQQYTARLLAPGYVGGLPNGLWNLDPSQFVEQVRAYHEAGLLIHAHCNGDEATELFLEAVKEVLVSSGRPDHRHTVTHSQLSTPAQYQRMAALGVGANIFSNHLWYWGDQHMKFTVGVDRARRMNAARTAIDAGVPIALHCDSPVTPLDPLATASYAAERRTSTGASIGQAERITVAEALHAVTLGAAYLLKLDHLVGSLAPGKFADMAVLDRDPFEVSKPAELRDITVLGTVVGGRHFPAPTS